MQKQRNVCRQGLKGFKKKKKKDPVELNVKTGRNTKLKWK